MSVRARRQGREEAFRLLFQSDQGVLDLEVEAHETRVGEEAWAFARELVEGALASREELDPVLDRLAVGWSIQRMGAADRAILRLAAYEVTARPDTPPSVCINEAVELAKRYGTDNSARFVNGILGSFVRERGIVTGGELVEPEQPE